MPGDDALIGRIEAYHDAAPRLGSTAEHHGPLTLFAPTRGGFPLYARPRQGRGDAPITAADVAEIRRRQRALALPEELEWVDDVDPSLGPACEAAGLHVVRHPLMVLDDPAPRTRSVAPALELVDVLDSAPEHVLRVALAVAATAFAHPGTRVGPRVELDDPVAGRHLAGLRSRLGDETLMTVLAVTDRRPVGVASVVLADGVAEVVGVGTVPDQRSRGIGSATTGAVVERARGRGAEVVFLSAADEHVAHLYASLGFRRIATAATASPPASP